MTEHPATLSPGTYHEKTISAEDLENCASESLHQIAQVQSHGFLLVCDPQDFRIVQYSRNIETQFSLSSEEILSCGLADFTGWHENLLLSARQHLETSQFYYAETIENARIKNSRWDCQLHHADRWLVCEFLPKTSTKALVDNSAGSDFSEVLEIIRSASDLNLLLERITEEIRSLTGYQRVMLYKFDTDWSGEVLAEATADGIIQKYKGLRFPASDIPEQARTLYRKNLLRLLVDVEDNQSTLYPESLPDGSQLDMTNCLLRAISKSHLTYLHNMNVGATLTFSLLDRGNLWGLVTCHHATKKHLDQSVLKRLRQQFPLIAEVIITSIRDRENERLNMRRYELSDFIKQEALKLSTREAETSGVNRLLKNSLVFFKCDLALLYTPAFTATEQNGSQQFNSPELIKEIKFQYAELIGKTAFSIKIDDDLLRDPRKKLVHTDTPMASIMIISLGNDAASFLCLLRKETSREIHWGGKPDSVVIRKESDSVILEPRRSFEKWIETVKGHATAWENEEQHAFIELAMILDKYFIEQESLNKSKTIEHQFYHDQVTGLPNIQGFYHFQNEYMNSKSSSLCHAALMMLDVDHFSHIIELHGQQAADHFLLMVATRLKKHCENQARLFKLDGNKFLIVLQNLPETKPDAIRLVTDFTHALQSLVYKKIKTDSINPSLTVSIGIKVLTSCDPNMGNAVKHASIALHNAKKTGNNHFSIFDNEDEQKLVAHNVLEKKLKEAVEKELFALYLQPQFDQNRKLCGCEALIRWKDPESGFISPETFIPMAEKNGRIQQIGRWVLNKACQYIDYFESHYPDQAFNVSVNFSPQQVYHPDFATSLQNTVQSFGIPPNRLILELTESIFESDFNIDRSILAAKDLEISFSLDDFGTGYSSFARLKDLPIHELKIDRSFIDEFCNNNKVYKVVKGIISLGKSLEMKIVAEGVETEEQFERLSALGCDVFQGYLLSKPLTFEDFEQDFLTY